MAEKSIEHEERKGLTRREFLRGAAAGLAAAAISAPALAATPRRLAQAAQQAAEEQQQTMLYRPIPACNIKISTIVSGPAGDAVQQRMVAHGVNYFHKVQGCGSKQFRQGLDWDNLYCDVVIDRLDRDQVIREFEAKRSQAGLDVIHFFKIHATLKKPEDLETHPGVFEAFEQLRDQGKTRWLAISLHAGAEMLDACVESGLFKQIQIMFNPLRADKATMQAIAKAHQRGIGIIAMKVMMGGPGRWNKNPRARQAIQQIQQEGRTPGQSILRWVLAQPGITAAVPKCANVQQADENCAAVLARMDEIDEQGVQALAAALSAEYCRSCRICEAACPHGLPIADILRYRMYALDYGERQGAAALYKALPEHLTASVCDGCGACEQVCPHGLRVVELLQDAHRVLV